MRLLLASVIGGLVLFVWAGMSHAVLDWYAAPFHEFEDGTAVLEVIERNASDSGLYYLPQDYEHRGAVTHAFINVVLPDRYRGFGVQMATGVVLHIITMLMVILLLFHRLPENYWRRVGLFSAAGGIIAFVTQAYYWNWFSFPTLYFALSVGDALVGWTLAGLVVAAILVKPQSRTGDRPCK